MQEAACKRLTFCMEPPPKTKFVTSNKPQGPKCNLRLREDSNCLVGFPTKSSPDKVHYIVYRLKSLCGVFFLRCKERVGSWFFAWYLSRDKICNFKQITGTKNVIYQGAKAKKLRLPGVEPGSIAWKAIILTVGLQTLSCLVIFNKIYI